MPMNEIIDLLWTQNRTYICDAETKPNRSICRDYLKDWQVTFLISDHVHGDVLPRTDREYVEPALDLWINQVVPLKKEYSNTGTGDSSITNLYYADEEKG